MGNERFRVRNSNFLFVSYSHLDQKQVLDFLVQLEKRGISFWYDKELKIGERWNERVQKNIASPNCVGSILFASEHWSGSDACQLELEYIKDHHKHIYVVCLGPSLDKSSFNLLKRYFDFDEKVIYARNDETSIDRFLATCIKDDIDVVNNYEVHANALIAAGQAHTEDGLVYVRLGEYPQNKLETVFRNYVDEVFYDEFDRHRYLQIPKSNHAYEFEKIDWLMVDATKDELLLVMKQSLISCLGRYEEIQKEIDKFKKRAGLGGYDVSVLSYDQLVRYETILNIKEEKESQFVMESYKHSENSFFILRDGEAAMVDQHLRLMNQGFISPSQVYGSPILIIKVIIHNKE